MKKVKSYTVEYERDEDGWWVGRVLEVAGVVTQGKSIDQTRKRIRKALALAATDAKGARFEEKIILPIGLQVFLGQFLEARRKREQLKEIEAKAARTIAKELSRRDASEVLGVSFQRVQQLME